LRGHPGRRPLRRRLLLSALRARGRHGRRAARRRRHRPGLALALGLGGRGTTRPQRGLPLPLRARGDAARAPARPPRVRGRAPPPQLSRLRRRGWVGRVEALPAAGSEPFFVAAARQGVPAATLLVEEARPFTPFLEGKRYGANYGRYLTLVDTEDTLRVSS